LWSECSEGSFRASVTSYNFGAATTDAKVGLLTSFVGSSAFPLPFMIVVIGW
jgi:hypothetical protein